MLSIIEALNVLGMARKKLISDFKIKVSEIYLPMFKYENHCELMNLALANYFTSWVNFHFVVWDQHYPGKSGTLIYQATRELLLKHSYVDEIDLCNYPFISRLISSKIFLIDSLIKKGEKDNEKYNALLLEYEKDKALFEREISRLKGNS